jgi:hypothetical protein
MDESIFDRSPLGRQLRKHRETRAVVGNLALGMSMAVARQSALSQVMYRITP